MYKYTAGILLFVTTILWNNASGQQEGIIIDVDFPGGNIIVVGNDNVSTLYYEVTGDTVLVRPDLRDTEGNWFYWYFRVTGAMNQTLHFHFPERHVGYFGPAISIDGGESWKWLYDDIQESYDRFIYTFGPSEVEVMFSVGIPYLQKNFDKFISSYANNRYVSLGYLTTSEKGRNVEKVYIHCTENDPKYKVLITARHHACEAMANYALEGIISSILDDGSSSMKWLRENVEFLIIPFMDKDGVEDGDQGKNRRPYDHNRDYSGESIYNSVTSLRKKVADWGGEKLKVALDLHCPYLVGGDWNENIYFPGSKEEKIAREQKKFVEILVRNHRGDLSVHPERSILEFGTSWNVSVNPSFRNWASTLKGISLAATLELPYANNNGQMIIPYNARLFGRDLAVAKSLYLQGL